MKKLLLVLVIAAILFWAYQLGKDLFFGPAKTIVKMYEGSASVYYVDEKGEREFLGTFKEGEKITVRPKNRGPFAVLNLAQYFVPQAVTIFKTTVGKLSEQQPAGTYARLFTETEFDEYISSKLRRSFLPDLNVVISPEGFTGTGTLIVGDKKIPLFGNGIVGIDKKKHGTMYVAFNKVRIGNFNVPKFILDMVANDCNKVIGKGTYAIEILDMKYRDHAIDIPYRRVEPGKMRVALSTESQFLQEEMEKGGPASAGLEELLPDKLPTVEVAKSSESAQASAPETDQKTV